MSQVDLTVTTVDVNGQEWDAVRCDDNGAVTFWPFANMEPEQALAWARARLDIPIEANGEPLIHLLDELDDPIHSLCGLPRDELSDADDRALDNCPVCHRLARKVEFSKVNGKEVSRALRMMVA